MTRRGTWRRARRLQTRPALALLALAAGLACPATDEATPTSETDPTPAMPAPTDLPADPTRPFAPRIERVVSLSPVASRFVAALGAGDRLVAVDPGSLDLPGIPDRPTTDLGDVLRFEPDLVLVPALPDDLDALPRIQSNVARLREFAPHDLEDVFALCRSLGAELVGAEAAGQLERQIARPLSFVAGESPAEGRPRILALVAVDPPQIAGGHSFETDLIEIAGGTSITHGSDDNRRPIDPAALARLAPDLVVVMTSTTLAPADEDSAIRFVGDVAPVEFFRFDPEFFWLEEPARDAKRLRALIVAFEAARADRERA